MREASVGGADPPLGERERIVVVGGGMTAQHFVERLVAAGVNEDSQVTVLAEELHAPYDRVHLGDVVGGADPHRLLMRPAEWYERHRIRLERKQRVLELDRDTRSVRTSSGDEIPYDHLVLATGGRAQLPPVEGIDRPGVVAYRTLEDAQRIAERAEPGRRAVVLGGGLLGLEAARGIQARGCGVEIVEAAPRLLPRQLDADGAAVLEAEIRALGLPLHLLTRVEAVRETERGLGLELDSGASLEADFVVVAAGIRPCDELAKAANLACLPAGGVIVDDRLTSSDPSVHAIGECAAHRGECYGFVAPCYAMAETLADRFAGADCHFTGALPSARLKIDEVDVVAVGESLAEGIGVSALTWRGDRAYRRIVLREGRIVGALSVGSHPEFPRLQEAVAEGRTLRAWQRRRFAREGRLWAGGGASAIRAWPDDAVVCTCTGTTCGVLRHAQANGCRSRLALSEATGAGTVCGSCAPLLSELVGETEEARRISAGGPLTLVALTALCAIGLALVLGPAPRSFSIEAGLGLDHLWRDAWWKQFTGFSLVGLCVLSLVFSLRKRWPRFRAGSYTGWRLAHTMLGIGTIAALGFHTGFRLGSNLNFALMICFSSVVGIGALAALVTSLEHRLAPGPAAWLRRGWTAAHVFVSWPLPVLIGFHVLSVYYY